MKKLLAVVIAISLLFSACGTNGNPTPSSEMPEASASQSALQTESISDNSQLGNTDESDKLPEIIEAFAATRYNEFEGDFPSEFIWATEAELKEFQAILSSLKLSDVKKFIAVSAPSDEVINKTMTPQQVTDIINKCKGIKPELFSKPENPATGGMLSLYIETDTKKILLGYCWNWLTMSIENEPYYWVFNAQPCKDTFKNIWDSVERLLNEQ